MVLDQDMLIVYIIFSVVNVYYVFARMIKWYFLLDVFKDWDQKYLMQKDGFPPVFKYEPQFHALVSLFGNHG